MAAFVCTGVFGNSTGEHLGLASLASALRLIFPRAAYPQFLFLLPCVSLLLQLAQRDLSSRLRFGMSPLAVTHGLATAQDFVRGLLSDADVLAKAVLAAVSPRVSWTPQAPLAMGEQGAVVFGFAQMALPLV